MGGEDKRAELLNKISGRVSAWTVNNIKNSYTTKTLKNKSVLNIKQYCMRCYVTLSNVFKLMRIKV